MFQGLNVYSILQHDTLVMTRDAVNRIVDCFNYLIIYYLQHLSLSLSLSLFNYLQKNNLLFTASLSLSLTIYRKIIYYLQHLSLSLSLSPLLFTRLLGYWDSKLITKLSIHVDAIAEKRDLEALPYHHLRYLQDSNKLIMFGFVFQEIG